MSEARERRGKATPQSAPPASEPANTAPPASDQASRAPRQRSQKRLRTLTPPDWTLLANCARVRAGRRQVVGPPGLAACRLCLECRTVAAGIGAHRQSRQQRGRLPLCGGSTPVTKGPVTTKGKSATLIEAHRACR